MSDFIKRSDAVEYVMSILDVNKYYHPHSKSRNVPIDEVVDRINQVPAADLSGQKAYDIRQLPEGLYALKNGVVYTARMKLSGGNVYNVETGESHWEDDRIVGGEQVLPKPEAEKLPNRGERTINPYESTWAIENGYI